MEGLDKLTEIIGTLRYVQKLRMHRAVERDELPLGVCDYDEIELDLSFLMANNAPAADVKGVFDVYNFRAVRDVQIGLNPFPRSFQRKCMATARELELWGKGRNNWILPPPRPDYDEFKDSVRLYLQRRES